MRGRFAPSPTGRFHLGNLRTAMLAWLFARGEGSTFALRVEDLNTEAVRAEHYDSQRRDLEAIGVDWDDELRQSDHLDRYVAAIDDLVATGRTYRCYCSRREIREAASAPHGDQPEGAYPGTCRHLSEQQRNQREAEGRDAAIRIMTDGSEVAFVDGVHGPTTARLDDAVLCRRDGTPAYNLVVVVDDAYQEIEQVVRGDDLLMSTPRQLHLGRALGLPDPAFAHVPLVAGPDGVRLAKRTGAVTLGDRLDLGETVPQVVGALAHSLGLVPAATETTLAELVDDFDPRRIGSKPWNLTETQLDSGFSAVPRQASDTRR